MSSVWKITGGGPLVLLGPENTNKSLSCDVRKGPLGEVAVTPDPMSSPWES